ncbi:PREDICTED: MATH domain and coiled-coil domain-containing protein At3g58370-like [Camelina sativa]|uniref:MATH domain and coiled-coil domain-containing protein At3g58370-like n=1 Tax=Camelina sativa TaxID=90675 RepID=A0ABM0SL45_CAMSA|nr:PREDICTED: MATH domain and coiled-coil domain-containing protein At3g58370-like [Camelina sativa]
MGDRLYENQFTWVINNFSSLQYDEKIYSDVFVIDGCNWRVVATLKGNKYDESLYLSLAVPDAESLPFGWRRRAEFSFTIVNQLSEKHSEVQDIFRDFTETTEVFDYNTPERGCASSIPLGKLDAKYCGLIFDEQVKIFGELDVLEVILQDIFRDFTETTEVFDYNTPERGCASSIPLGKLDAKYCGLIFDEQVKIFGELDVLEVICKYEPISIELHGYVQSSSVF